MLLLGLDFETTGLDVAEDRVLEVGLVLWDVPTNQPVRMEGFLVAPDIDIPDEKWSEIAKINGITKEIIENYGLNAMTALKRLDAYILRADAVVTFNGTEFDLPFYQNWSARYTGLIERRVWVDTRLDPLQPLDRGSLMLHAAMAGFVNPFPHRAVTDVLAMFKVLGLQDMVAMCYRAQTPTITVAAVDLPFERKDEAKVRGYFWDKPTGCKLWKKRIKECDLAKEQAEAGFLVQQVQA